MKSISGSPIVDEISKLHINSIPEAWYKNIRHKKSPHAMAILILWDLLYWYKWTEVRDETSGNVIGFKKKFKADLLQRSYTGIAEKFGISKNTAQDIIYFLEQVGVLVRRFRTITIGDTKMGNVLFIELIPQKIKEISEFTTDDFSSDDGKVSDNEEDESGEKEIENLSTPMDEFSDPSGEISLQGSMKNIQTNTTNTQSTSQSNSHCSSRSSTARTESSKKSKTKAFDEYLNSISDDDKTNAELLTQYMFDSFRETDPKYNRRAEQLLEWQVEFAKFLIESQRSIQEVIATLRYGFKSDYWSQYIFNPKSFIKNYEKLLRQSVNHTRWENEHNNKSEFTDGWTPEKKRALGQKISLAKIAFTEKGGWAK